MKTKYSKNYLIRMNSYIEYMTVSELKTVEGLILNKVRLEWRKANDGRKQCLKILHTLILQELIFRNKTKEISLHQILTDEVSIFESN